MALDAVSSARLHHNFPNGPRILSRISFSTSPPPAIQSMALWQDCVISAGQLVMGCFMPEPEGRKDVEGVGLVENEAEPPHRHDGSHGDDTPGVIQMGRKAEAAENDGRLSPTAKKLADAIGEAPVKPSPHLSSAAHADQLPDLLDEPAARITPVQIDSPAPIAPVQIDSPAPTAPMQIDSPAPIAPVQIDSPAPIAPVQIDSPALIESPAPVVHALQTTPSSTSLPMAPMLAPPPSTPPPPGTAPVSLLSAREESAEAPASGTPSQAPSGMGQLHAALGDQSAKTVAAVVAETGDRVRKAMLEAAETARIEASAAAKRAALAAAEKRAAQQVASAREMAREEEMARLRAAEIEAAAAQARAAAEAQAAGEAEAHVAAEAANKKALAAAEAAEPLAKEAREAILAHATAARPSLEERMHKAMLEASLMRPFSQHATRTSPPYISPVVFSLNFATRPSNESLLPQGRGRAMLTRMRMLGPSRESLLRRRPRRRTLRALRLCRLRKTSATKRENRVSFGVLRVFNADVRPGSFTFSTCVTATVHVQRAAVQRV